MLFECVALPKRAVAVLAAEEITIATARALCQWQLEVPLTHGAEIPSFGSWFAVIEKILKRGKTVILSPVLEDALRDMVADMELYEGDWRYPLHLAAKLDRPAPPWIDGFDSSEEKLFFTEVLCQTCGEHVRGWVQRQVSLDALCQSANTAVTNRRIDFLVAHPSGLQVAVEIDGAQHADQRVADKARDSELVAAGIEVVRIPVDEIRLGRGAKLRHLKDLLSGVVSVRDDSPVVRFLRMTRRAHQIQLALWQGLALGAIPLSESRTVYVQVNCD